MPSSAEAGTDAFFFISLDRNTSWEASNFPEQIRINAILSLWFLFIFAWILKTKAEKSSFMGSMTPISAVLGRGEDVIFEEMLQECLYTKVGEGGAEKYGR